MFFKSKKASLLILGIAALVSTRAMLFFFNDPEGPNLLVVIGMALVVYLFSLTVYAFDFRATGPKKLCLAIFIQLALVTGLYFFLQ